MKLVKLNFQERNSILKISALIQNKVSSMAKTQLLSQILSVKVLINLAPSGEVLSLT